MEINVIFVNLNIKKERVDIEIDLHVNKAFDDIAKPIGEGIIGKSFIVA